MRTLMCRTTTCQDASRGLGAGRPRSLAIGATLADDYRKAYGAEPGPVLAVVVMTDTDNTGTKAVGSYAHIRIDCGSR